jgi:hypothetical protein
LSTWISDCFSTLHCIQAYIQGGWLTLITVHETFTVLHLNVSFMWNMACLCVYISIEYVR